MHQWVYRVCLIGLAGLITVISSCSDNSSGPEPPPEPQNITITVDPQLDGETYEEAEIYNDATNSKLGDGKTSIEEDKATTMTIRVAGPNIHPETTSLTFDEDKTETIALQAAEPETAKLSYRIEDDSGELADGGKLFIADTLAADSPEGTVTLPYGASDTACGRAENTEEVCKDFSLEGGDDELSFTLARKMVTITVTPEIADFAARDRGIRDDETEYRLTVGDKTFVNTGPNGVNLQEGKAIGIDVPAGSEAITVSGRFIYLQKERKISEFFHRSLAEGETTVSPTENRSVTLTLTHQPACSDGIDNNLDEQTDREDGGCVADNSPTFKQDKSSWVYDADDDDERLIIVGGYFNFQQEELKFVSSKEGERRANLFGRTFTQRIKYAVGEVLFYLESKIETVQTGEEAAIEIKCKPEGSDTHGDDLKAYISDIIKDDQAVDGWRESTVTGISGELFAQEGVECGLWLIDGTLARGEAAGDGKDDFVIATSERAVSMAIEYAIEPEDVPDDVGLAGANRRQLDEPQQ